MGTFPSRHSANYRKLGFFPLEEQTTRLIAANILPAETTGTLIDPFGGEGVAGARLASLLNLTPYFVEIEEPRAALCAEKGATLHGPSEFLDSRGGWSLALLNPPYAYDQPARRLEIYYWNEVKDSVCQPGTLVALVVPLRTVNENEHFARDIFRYLDEPFARRLPEPEWHDFRQIVIIGRARPKPIPHGTLPRYISALAELQNPWKVLRDERLNLGLTNLRPVTRFALSLPNWEAVEAEAFSVGALASAQWNELQTPTSGQGNITPAERLGKGHAVAAVLAGLANGLEIEGAIIKGRTRKYTTKIERTTVLEDGKILEEKGEAESFAGVLSMLRLSDLSLQVLDEALNPDGYQAFIETHLIPLATHIDERYPPLFEGDLRPYLSLFRLMRGPKRLPGLPDAPLQIQYQKAGALVRGFDKHPVMICVGDMGVGKTTLSLVTMMVTALRKNSYKLDPLTDEISQGANVKIVAWCPGHLIFDKWKAEALKILRMFNVQVVVVGEERRWADGAKASRPLEDIRRAMAEPGPVVLILSNQRAKNGTAWKPRVLRKKMRYPQALWKDETKPEYYYQLHCPTCGSLLKDEEGEQRAFMPAKEQLLDNAPDPHPEKRRKSERYCRCALFTEGEAGGSFGAHALYDSYLREQLGKPLNPAEQKALARQRKEAGKHHVLPPTSFDPKRKGLAVGMRRFPAAEYLSQRYANQYYLIIDEAHETKASDTDIGLASADLIFGARRTLLMTGTPYGGYASTIFNISHRSLPWFRLIYRHTDTSKFVGDFGLRKAVKSRVIDPNDSRAASRQGYRRDDDEGFRSRITELPGAHPGIVMLLAPITVWLGQDELNIVLPKYTEKRLPVPLPPEWEHITEAYDNLKRAATQKDANGWSAYMQAVLGHLDRPEEEVFRFLMTEARLPRLSPPGGASDLPKVKAVCDLVADRWHKARRRSIIFFQQVNARDPMPYYVAALENRGLSPIVLRGSVDGPKRGAYIQRAVDQGGNVLLCNGKLVQTGLDLVQFSATWRVQPTWSPYDELQQNKRTHRIGQTEDCEMIWVYYDFPGSMQAYAVNLMAKKMKAIAHVGGKMAQGLAATDPDGLGFWDKLIRMAEETPELDWEGLEIVQVLDERAHGDVPADQIADPEPARIVAAPAKASVVPADSEQQCSHDRYTLLCTGRNILHLQNGGPGVSVSWLGADRLHGPTEAVEIIRAHFQTHLNKNKPTKKWAVEADVPHA